MKLSQEKKKGDRKKIMLFKENNEKNIWKFLRKLEFSAILYD